jgi:hypothetical protein
LWHVKKPYNLPWKSQIIVEIHSLSHLQLQLLSRQPKAGIRRVSRTGIELPMQAVTKSYEFQIKPLQLRQACFPGSNLEQAAPNSVTQRDQQVV